MLFLFLGEGIWLLFSASELLLFESAEALVKYFLRYPGTLFFEEEDIGGAFFASLLSIILLAYLFIKLFCELISLSPYIMNG